MATKKKTSAMALSVQIKTARSGDDSLASRVSKSIGKSKLSESKSSTFCFTGTVDFKTPRFSFSKSTYFERLWYGPIMMQVGPRDPKSPLKPIKSVLGDAAMKKFIEQAEKTYSEGGEKQIVKLSVKDHPGFYFKRKGFKKFIGLAKKCLIHKTDWIKDMKWKAS